MAKGTKSSTPRTVKTKRFPGDPNDLVFSIKGKGGKNAAELVAEFKDGGVFVRIIRVLPDAQGQGAAKALYESLGREMKKRGVTTFLHDDMIVPESRAAVEKLRRAALAIAEPTPRVTKGFTGKNKEAIRVAERQAGRLVTAVSRDTRDAIRATITRAIRDQIPPYEAAKSVRQLIGLTPSQSQATLNYRESLINAGHTMAKTDQLVEKYVGKKLRERSERIARTETMQALNAGQLEIAKEMQAEGLLGMNAIQEWITTPDDALCDVCAEMDGVTAPVGQPFVIEGPPAHPNCRCTVAILSA